MSNVRKAAGCSGDTVYIGLVTAEGSGGERDESRGPSLRQEALNATLIYSRLWGAPGSPAGTEQGKYLVRDEPQRQLLERQGKLDIGRSRKKAC